MKKVLAAAGIGAALTAGPLVGAGIASASSNQEFLSELHAEGFYNPAGDSAMPSDGYRVCQWLDQGATQGFASNALYQDENMSILDANLFVVLADMYLC